MKLKQISPVVVMAAIGLTSLFAQEKKRVSPHETVNATIDGAQISIVYGRPYIKDPKSGAPRKIWGDLVPFGKPWRTGADEATTLTTSKALQIGEATVPAGTYTLFTQPEETGASKLIINKQTGQWGTKYDPSQDLARVDLTKKDLSASVNQFTIAIEKSSGGGAITLRWEKTEFSAPFKVKP
jgi:DUF2911 family protein